MLLLARTPGHVFLGMSHTGSPLFGHSLATCFPSHGSEQVHLSLGNHPESLHKEQDPMESFGLSL